nr:MAG TPA: hypothetical protein [Caudoviricetes sp.]
MHYTTWKTKTQVFCLIGLTRRVKRVKLFLC